MLEGYKGCPDCIVHPKIASEVKEHAEDHAELKNDFKEHKKAIWEATNSKLSSGMFKWALGFIILFSMSMGSLQITLISQMSELKKDIAILQILLEKNNATQEEVTSK